ALAEQRDLVLMPGHLLLYHPGIQKVKQLIDAGEIGEVYCIYGNRQNLGVIRKDENALWSLGVHDLSVILYLLDEEPDEVWAHGASGPGDHKEAHDGLAVVRALDALQSTLEGVRA